MYSVGNRLRISLFGKSHADCIGCIMEGVPIGMPVDVGHVREQMSLRKPSDGIGTPRKEADEVVFEYGLNDGIATDGTLLMTIYNGNKNSAAYDKFKIRPRPGHADLPALFKFKDYDVAGGAQFSGRMTAPLVAAGAVAKQYLKKKGIDIAAFTRSIGDIRDVKQYDVSEYGRSVSYRTRAMDADMDRTMTDTITKAGSEGDSVGGIIECAVTGLPIGFGGEWFDALDVSVARMMFSIPAVKGVEFGAGFGITEMKGSESNDQYTVKDGRITAKSNNMGGVTGGLSNGMPLVFRVAIKPTPSIAKEQRTVNLETMEEDSISVTGRHDPCIVPRAVAVVEAMAAIAIMDQELSFTPF